MSRTPPPRPWSRCCVTGCCCPRGCDVHTALRQLRELEQEDPLLHVVWDERLGQVHLQLMGEVQLEILQSLLERRFGLKVTFDEGGILYKETITSRVEGVGHYEPLRHYAEVHLLMEPGPRGSGVEIATACREDELAGNWQRLILTHLAEKTHLGPLMGAPLTDVKLTLAVGPRPPQAHRGRGLPPGHLPGGAPGPADRPGPGRVPCCWSPGTEFTLRLPQDAVGRALADMPRLCAQFEPPETQGEEAVTHGRAPVACLRGYAREVAAYTKGRGQLSCLPRRLRPVPQHRGGRRRGGLRHRRGHWRTLRTPCSAATAPALWCAGTRCRSTCTCPACWPGGSVWPGRPRRRPRSEAPAPEARAAAYRDMLAPDKELMAIFERTYGPIQRDPRAGHAPGEKPASRGPKLRRAKGKALPGTGRSTCWWTATTSSSPGTS